LSLRVRAPLAADGKSHYARFLGILDGLTVQP
jgi:hypothetical protein